MTETKLSHNSMQPTSLATRHCVPCEGGTAPLSATAEEMYLSATPAWQLNQTTLHTISRDFEFKNFGETIKFVNKVAEIAESEGHHPDILIHNYKHAQITL